MRLMMLLVGLAVSLSGCGASLPKPPEGNLYLHWAPNDIALCSDIQSGKTCDPVNIHDTHKWYLFPPKTWESIQNYIDELIRRVEAKEHELDTMGTKGYVLTTKDLQQMKAHLLYLKKRLTPVRR